MLVVVVLSEALPIIILHVCKRLMLFTLTNFVGEIDTPKEDVIEIWGKSPSSDGIRVVRWW